MEAEVEVVRLEGQVEARQGQLTEPVVDRIVDTWHNRLGIHHKPNTDPGRNTAHIERRSLLNFRHPVRLGHRLYLGATE